MSKRFLSVVAAVMALCGAGFAQSDLTSNTNYLTSVGWHREKGDFSVIDPGGHSGKVAAFYSFAFDGGAVGAIDLDAFIPTNAIIYDGLVDVVQPILPVAIGATNALTMNSYGDIVAGSTNQMGVQGRVAVIPISAATSVRATAQRSLYLTRTGTAATSGVVMVWLDWVLTLPR